MYRQTWVEINGENIRENIKSFKQHLGRDVGVVAVVKANAYGHDAATVSRIAEKEGVAFLAVATLDEACYLREQGLKTKILVLGYVEPRFANMAAKNNVSLTAFRSDWLHEASDSLEPGLNLNIHVKIDTGMNRLGIKYNDDESIDIFVKTIKETNNINAEGIFTHFATSDEINNDFVTVQLNRFKEVLKIFSTMGISFSYTHCGNSAFNLRFPDEPFNLARIGISMYGLTPSTEMESSLPFQLKPAFSLYSKLVNIKKITKGETVGYGQTFVADDDVIVGTVPIGYADGVDKRYKIGEVIVDGNRCQIIGSVCMDQLMIKLPREYKIGELVTLIGKDKEEEITVDEVAEKLETINYEVVCMIGSRVPRKLK